MFVYGNVLARNIDSLFSRREMAFSRSPATDFPMCLSFRVSLVAILESKWQRIFLGTG